ncbi:MAG: porin family protein [bacterium]
MKKITLLALAVFFCAAAANAESRFGVGLRAGPSVFSQEVFEADVDQEVGPVVAGDLLYLVNNWFAFGLSAEWETHSYQAGDLDVADNWTVSVYPFAQFRGPYSSYVFLGAGYNFNSFDLDGPEELEVDDSLALKAGFGWDIFVSDNIALNIELGWKYNRGDMDLVAADGTTTFVDDLNMSVITALFGVRYYF